MKVGLARGLFGETTGLGTGEGGKVVGSCSGVEGREEEGVVRELESKGDTKEEQKLFKGIAEGFGGRGG